MPTHDDLLTLADAYASLTGASETTISSRVFDDSKKLAALRVGKDITLRRFNAALAWFSANWPHGAEWPREVSRPAPSSCHPPCPEAAE
jgi:hypothetical protein